MKLMKIAAAAVLPLALSSLCHSQDLDAVNVLWKQTVTAVRHADNQAARASLARFTTTAASYVQTHGRSWEIEYLVGSVDCMFTDKRATGAEFLQDILANSRSLSEAGQAELRRQLDACNDSAQGSSTTLETATPPELADVSTHFQSVGIRGEMKGGGDVDDAQESVGAVSPIPEAELAARLVSVDQPDKALHDGAPIPIGSWSGRRRFRRGLCDRLRGTGQDDHRLPGEIRTAPQIRVPDPFFALHGHGLFREL
jgi:hypothetical protein